MPFTIHLYADESTPFTEQLPLQLLCHGEVIAQSVPAADGTVTFDCDVPPTAELAIRLDKDHPMFKPE